MGFFFFNFERISFLLLQSSPLGKHFLSFCFSSPSTVSASTSSTDFYIILYHMFHILAVI